jgi:hypothetical protein
MHSTLNFEQADPRPVLGSQGNEKLASDERTVREELARLQERQSSVAHDAASVSLDPQVTAFRPAAVNDVRDDALGRPAVRGAIGFLLVACIIGGAIVWQSSYGHAARLIIAQWTPSLISTSAPALEKSEAAAEPTSQPAAQTAVADATTQPSTPQAQAVTAPAQAAPQAPQDVATASASLPPEQSQLLQTMARDLAAAQQKIAELRTSQEQLARDNATTAEQLKAAQQQIARLTATTKVSEQNLRPKPVAPPPPRRPIAAMTAPVRQPVAMVPPPPPPQTIAPPPQAPAYPPQASAYPQTMPAPQPQGDPVQMSSAPRPPMPVPQ